MRQPQCGKTKSDVYAGAKASAGAGRSGPHGNVEAELWPGLLADFAVAHGAGVIVRGVRNVTDFDVEYQMALINRGFIRQLETVSACQPCVPAFQLLHGPGDDRYRQPLEKYLPAEIIPMVREMTQKRKEE